MINNQLTSITTYLKKVCLISILERAIEIAAKAYAGQVDKADEAYILHSLKVMPSFDNEEECIVGTSLKNSLGSEGFS